VVLGRLLLRRREALPPLDPAGAARGGGSRARVTPERRVRAGAIAILSVGFAAAIAIFVTARPTPPNPLGYEPEDTKKYVRDMELYAGKGNLVASQIRKWFGSLWHGRRLAATVAVLTVAAAGAYAFFTLPLPPEPEDERRGHVDP